MKISFDELKDEYLPLYLSYLGYKKVSNKDTEKYLLDEEAFGIFIFTIN